VFQSNLNDRFLFDSIQVTEAQLFPKAAFGIFMPLTDSLGITDNLIWAGKGNYFVKLTDFLSLQESLTASNTGRSILIALNDSFGLTDLTSVKATGKGYFTSLSDTLGVVEAMTPYNTGRSILVALSDSFSVSDLNSYRATGKGYFVALYDKLDGITDEFDVIKAKRNITISLTDSLNLQE
jgi:hypothetical protein